MKEKKSYNLLITIWLWVILIGILPVLGRNLLVSLPLGAGTPAYYKVPYVLLIVGGLVYLAGYILLVCKCRSGLWLAFLSLPVAYALAQLDLYYFGLPGSGHGGIMFVVYIILPLLLNLVTVALLFLRRAGRSGWDLLRGQKLENLREEDEQADGGRGEGAEEDACGA